MYGQLFFRSVFLLHNRHHIALSVTDNTAVAKRIFQYRRQDSCSGIIIFTGIRQLPYRRFSEKRCIPADHQDISIRLLLKFRHGLHDGMCRSQLFFLMNKNDILLCQTFSYIFFFKPGNSNAFFISRCFDDTNNLFYHRNPAYLMQDLGQSRFHSCSLPCSQNHRYQTFHTSS